MKNLIKYLLSMLVLFLIPVSMFAIDVGTSNPGISFDPATWFVTLSAFVALVMAVTQFLKKAINFTGFLAKLLSWLVAIIAAAIGWWLQLGIFAGLTWYWGLIYALAAGLLANGVFDIGIVNAIITFIKQFIKKPQ